MNERSAKWLLYFPPATTNDYSFKATGRRSYTYYNIDLERIMGDLYQKYDFFKLNLISICTVNPTLDNWTSEEDKTAIINIQGFPFINASNGDTHKIATFKNIEHTNVLQLYNEDNSVIFRKPMGKTNFIIYYTRASDNSIGTSNYTNICFYFSISGVNL